MSLKCTSLHPQNSSDSPCLQVKCHFIDSLWSISIPTTCPSQHTSAQPGTSISVQPGASISLYLRTSHYIPLQVVGLQFVALTWIHMKKLCHRSCFFACSRVWYLFFLLCALQGMHHAGEPILHAIPSYHQNKMSLFSAYCCMSVITILSFFVETIHPSANLF